MVSALGLCGRRSRRRRAGSVFTRRGSERTKDSGSGPNALFPENINAFCPNGRRVSGSDSLPQEASWWL